MRGLSGTPRAAAAFLLCGLVAAWGTGCRSIQNPPPLQDGGFVAMPLDDAAVRRAGAHAWYATAAGAERDPPGSTTTVSPSSLEVRSG